MNKQSQICGPNLFNKVDFETKGEIYLAGGLMIDKLQNVFKFLLNVKFATSQSVDK